MEFGILGPLQLRSGGRDIGIRSGIPRALLTWLVLRAPDVVAADVLIERLWGNQPPANPANALQTQIAYVRRTLRDATMPKSGQGSGTPALDQALVTRAGGYALEVAESAIDARCFERLVSNASLESLERALRLWRADPLAEIASHPDAAGERARLQELHLGALEQRIALLLASGKQKEALADLGALVTEHPFRERFHAQLMLALYREGRQADALRAFEHARRLLADELGLHPGPELRDLEAQILAQDSALRVVAATALEPVSRPWVSSRATVPSPVTPLIGRDIEVIHVLGLLDRTRHVTLTGPGGAGKTRLAVEVARRLQESSQVWFVDLSGTHAGAVVATVAAAVGAVTSPGDDEIAAIAAHVVGERGLLVLDTCEHIVHDAAAVAAAVLRTAPDVRVLATSRRALALTGELAWPVPPLALPPPSARGVAEVGRHAAVSLFCERAYGARGEFALTDDNAADIAAICLALDGLPLAIELAAAQVDVLSVASIRRKLADRFSLLVTDVQDGSDRQRTLRGAIAWSVELLSDDERRLLAELGVFAGSFELEAVARVTHAAGDGGYGLLRSLIRQSLVVVVGDERFRLLDSIRAYALELLDVDGDGHGVRDRHASYYAEVAEAAERGLRSADQEAWLKRVRAELPNMRAALDWSFAAGGASVTGVRLATSLAWFWTFEGMFAEATERLEVARTAGIDDARLQARVLIGLTYQALPLGNVAAARAWSAEASDLARSAGARGALGLALVNLGVSEWALGDLDAAAAAHDEAIERSSTAPDPWCLHMALTMRARTAIDAGDLDVAHRLLERARPLLESSPDRQLFGLMLEQCARLALAAGRIDDAAALADEALTLQEAAGYREGVAAALHLVAMTASAAGDHQRAAGVHQRALLESRAIGLTAGVIEALEALAELAVSGGNDATAARLLAAADAERERTHLPVRGVDRPRLDALRRAVAPLLKAMPAPEVHLVIEEALRA